MTEAEIVRQLSALVLYPKRAGGNSVRIEGGGPLCVLCWGSDGLELFVSFTGGRERRIPAEVVSTGKSQWRREQTHRLAPEFAAKVGASIARVMADPRFEQVRAGGGER